MAIKIIPLQSLSRVTPGSVATLELPLGPTYKRLFFEVTGTGLIAAHVGEIKVLVNGSAVQTFRDLQRLIDLNSYYQRGGDTVAQFCIHFERPEMHDMASRRAPGYGTQDVQTFTIELTLVAGAPANIAMKAYAVVDTDAAPLGVFYKVIQTPFNSAVAGEVEVNNLVKGGWYSAIHLFKADVTDAKLVVNWTDVVKAPKSILERTQREASPNKRVPLTAKATHIDFLIEGDMWQSLATQKLKDFRVFATLGSAGAMDIVSETLDTL